MASSTQKKTTTKKSGSRSGSRTAKGKQPQKRPIRREVGGVILLVLALCVLVSYCGVQAILIDLLAKLLKGLFGYGYWLAGPAMLLAGGILLLHPGPPGHPAGHLRPAAAAAGRSAVPHHFRRGRLCAERLGRFEESLGRRPCPEGGRRRFRPAGGGGGAGGLQGGVSLPLRLAAGGSAAGGPACDALRRSGDGTEPAGVRGGAGAYARPSTSLLRSRPGGGESARAGPPSTFPWTARSRPHSRRKSPAGLPASSGISPTR